MNPFSDLDERYSRQIFFEKIGEKGQQKIISSRVLIVGCGGLGSVSAEILARAGVGFLRLVDRDYLELNNLQRQILYDEADIRDGLPKAIAAKNKLAKINSNIKVEALVTDVNRLNIESLLDEIDLVIDGTDNFSSRQLINEACVKTKTPWIYGACVEAHGLSMTIIPGKTPCFRCVFESRVEDSMVQTCNEVGIIGPIVNVIASMQCAEALKYLSDQKSELAATLRSVDLWQNEFQEIDISTANQQKKCTVCNYHQYNLLAGKHGITYASVIGINTVQIIPFAEKELDLMQLAIELAQYGDPLYNEYVLKLTREDYEIVIFRDGRSIIKGTEDFGIARAIYSKYIGN